MSFRRGSLCPGSIGEPAAVDAWPLPRRLDAAEFRQLGNQPDIAEIGREQRAGKILQIVGLLRAGNELGGIDVDRPDGIFIGRVVRSDASVGEIMAEFGDGAGKQHVETGEIGRIGRAHQRLDLVDMVEARRQAVDRRNLQLAQQRLRLALRPVVARPDRLVGADVVDGAHLVYLGIGGRRPGVDLAGLEERPERRGNGLVVGGAEGGGGEE